MGEDAQVAGDRSPRALTRPSPLGERGMAKSQAAAAKSGSAWLRPVQRNRPAPVLRLSVSGKAVPQKPHSAVRRPTYQCERPQPGQWFTWSSRQAIW